ncbi:hypothetical protein ACW7G0_12545 [Lysobacter sp. A286]
MGNEVFESKDYWQGHNLSLPTGGGEMLLLDPGHPRPSTGGPYYWVTGDQTRVACLSAIKNWTGGGEGFLAIAPDGTKYWFDWMGQYLEPIIESTTTTFVLGVPKTSTQRHARRHNVLYPTRVEDRFGNWVTYTYTNARTAPVRLVSIQSSDARRIDVHYNAIGHVSSVVAHGQTWSYQYAAANAVDKTLASVTLPDASSWAIEFSDLLASRVEYTRGVPSEPWRSCVHHPDLISPESFSGRVTHPSGAVGDFTVKVQLHGRTNVPLNCNNFTAPHNDRNDDVSFWTISHHGLSLAEKKISGPGLSTGTWTYAYSSPSSYYYPGGDSSYPVCPPGTDCSIPRCTSDDCAGSSRTTVTDPVGHWIRYHHGNSYRYNEGKLLKVEEGTGATVLRSIWSTYDLTQLDHEYPAKWGTSPRMIGDGFTSEYHRPLLHKAIAQDGASFNYRVDTFDAFARPVKVIRSSKGADGSYINPPAGAPALTAPATSNNGAFTVSWTAAGNATSYRLEQSKDSGTWSQIYSGAALSDAVSGLINGSYDYRARACNAVGCSSYSAIKTTVVTLPPASAPTVTAPTTSNNGAFTVSWTAVGTATNYRLEQQKDSGSWSQIYSGSAQSKAVSGLVNGSYGYRARACNVGGCGGYSAIKATLVTLPPASAPTVTAPATSNSGAFSVSWTAVGTATNYRLEQRKDSGSWSQIYSGAALSDAVSGLGNGSYGYRARACNASGCGSYSAIKATAVALPPASAPAVTAPATSNSGAFSVSWTAVGTATDYRLEQRKDSGSWSQIYSGTARSKALSGLGNGSYGYRARACNAVGCSSYSAIKTTVVTLPPASAPAVTAPSASNNGAFTVSWTAVGTATNYRLEQQKDSGSWSQIYSGSARSKAVSGLVNGSYGYRARACNAVGCSSYSAIKTTVVTLPPASAPTVTAPSASNNGAFTVSWTAVGTATNYRLEQQKDSGSWSQIYSGTARSKAVSGLVNGSYGYRARACNVGGCGGYSAIKATLVTLPPASAPTVTAPTTSNSGAFSVSWTAVGTATNYRLEQRKDSGSWSQIYSGSASSKAVSSLGNGSYGYRARACNVGGCGSYSAIKTTVVTLPPASPPAVTAPSASNNGAFAVSWTAVGTATNYRLEQQKDSGSWSQIYSGSARSKAVSGLVNGSYGYRARACNAVGCSTYSAVKTTTVTFPPSTAPALTAPKSAGTTQTYTVRWTLVTTATRYELQMNRNSAGWTGIYTGTGVYQSQSQRYEGNYAYRVLACNAGGCSAYSPAKNVLIYGGGGGGNCGDRPCPEPNAIPPDEPLTQSVSDEGDA